MALKHGCAAPTGITITGALIHSVKQREEIVAIESMDEEGEFATGQGKILRNKVTLVVSGEGLSTLSLPAKGTGAATAVSPMIQDTDIEDKNEGASAFTLTAYYYEAGGTDY